MHWQRSKGAFFDIENPITPEMVSKQWETINDFDEDAEYPDGANSAMGAVMQQIQSKL